MQSDAVRRGGANVRAAASAPPGATVSARAAAAAQWRGAVAVRVSS